MELYRYFESIATSYLNLNQIEDVLTATSKDS